MPGILPMKVIKVGANAASRIAQACDRCRSKKIRCDGVRPYCSQCGNVGFECRTSDKLSRRAFPRGYTDSLEDRVRGLESEVRELKDLLDEKDEKIDMLARIHSQSSHSMHWPSPRRTSTTSHSSKLAEKSLSPPTKDEVFKVQQSPCLLGGQGSDAYFAGTSSGRTFIEAFKHKVMEAGKSTADINTDKLLASALRKPSDTPSNPVSRAEWHVPPRMMSDQMINIYFQEWAPLFPVLHQPAFLSLYEQYVSEPDTISDKAQLAQLNLVFCIAALFSGIRASADLASLEAQWKAALDATLTENTMSTLQGLILAQIYCIQVGDLTRLLTYKGLSTSLSARLGLHQSQKRFALDTLACETRKKVFWTLYTVDSFSAVLLGLPKHLKDDDVHCEYPVDADDEYVTEQGFQPTFPGESTKLSSALALFRVSRILSKVLEEVFPATTSYELSFEKLGELQDELDSWLASLAPHLRMQFAQDKPSVCTVSSRSPLLSLTYHYIRALIQRPAVCASLGSRSSSSIMTMAGSCKSIIQILELLKERGLSFAFCLNNDELLVLSGFGLLFQNLTLDPSSKILKDNSKMICSVIELLDQSAAPRAKDFRHVACSFLPLQQAPKPKQQVRPQSPLPQLPVLSRHNSDGAMPAPRNVHSSTRKQLKTIASRFTDSITGKVSKPNTADHCRATMPQMSLHQNSPKAQSVPNLQLTYDPSHISRSEPARSPMNMYSRFSSTATRPSAPPTIKPKRSAQPQNLTNIDYLSFDAPSELNPRAEAIQPVKTEPGPTDWERLLGSLDNGQMNIYDATHGGRPIGALLDSTSLNRSSQAFAADDALDWNSDWSLGNKSDSCYLYQTTPNASLGTMATGVTTGQSESVLSFSTDDGLTSCEDFSSADWGSASADSSHNGNDAYRGIVMLETGGEDGLFGSSWDGGLTL